MGKRGAKVLSALLAATCAAMPLAACGGTENDPDTLNIICLDKGYGTEWLQEIADKYQEQSGKKVNITASANAAGTIKTHLASSKNTDDLYISVGNDWKAFSAQGKFCNLDDLMEEEIDGKKFKDRIMVDYAESVYFPDRNGEFHTYRLPWTAGVGGIFYNAKIFEDNGWTVPTTYAELLTLCQTIVDDAAPVNPQSTDRIVPFIYTGDNTDYFDYAVLTWWGQLAGKDAITEFCKYENKDNWNSETNATYGKLKEATGLWYDIFKESAYATNIPNNITAQNQFINGYSAMMFNGDWIYNEALRSNIDLEGKFELGYMKTPTAPGAAETDITYTVGEDQYIAIPESSIKKDMAKDFIKLMTSDWGCEVFAKKAHGILAYNGTLKAQTGDEFMQNLIEVKQSYSNAFTSFPPVKSIDNIKQSNCMLNLNGMVDIWGAGDTRPFKRLLDKTSDLDGAFAKIRDTVSSQWDDWKYQIGL